MCCQYLLAAWKGPGSTCGIHIPKFMHLQVRHVNLKKPMETRKWILLWRCRLLSSDRERACRSYSSLMDRNNTKIDTWYLQDTLHSHPLVIPHTMRQNFVHPNHDMDSLYQAVFQKTAFFLQNIQTSPGQSAGISGLAGNIQPCPKKMIWGQKQPQCVLEKGNPSLPCGLTWPSWM